MFVAYFLVFLYKSKVNTTRDNLKMTFKTKIKFIQEEHKKTLGYVEEKLKESRENYQKAVDKISSLELQVEKLTMSLKILIGEDKYERTYINTRDEEVDD
jgi:hypothetical protein